MQKEAQNQEIEIIKSRFLTEKALKKVDFSHRYYTTKRFKEIELYKNSPFRVGMLKGFGISFDLFPIDENNYRLVVQEAEDSNGNIWSYDQVLSYDKEIITQHFHININKVQDPEDTKYRFTVIDPKEVASYVHGGVSVSQSSKYSTILTI